jgi:hypothetical protein
MKKSTFRSTLYSLLTPCFIFAIGSVLTISISFSDSPFSGSIKKEDDTIHVKLHFQPREVRPGDSGFIKVEIEPAKGIKLTKYPQTSVTLSGDEEIIFEKNVLKLGQEKLPKDIKKNFLEKIDLLEFKFKVEETVEKSMLNVKANISYFYCVSRSGFCAPGTKNIEFQIPVKKKNS